MTITYDDIKHKLQPPVDCSGITDLRGRYFHNRLIVNDENTDFSGCVLYHCDLQIKDLESRKSLAILHFCIKNTRSESCQLL